MLTSILIIKNLWLKAFLCLITSYLLGVFSIKKYIKIMNQKNLFQPIRADGPQTHLQNKKTTPTMGGIFIILATIFTTILFVDLKNQYVLIVTIIMLCFAIIGLIDDLMKVLFKNPKGFRGSYRIVIQFSIIGLAFLGLMKINTEHGNGQIFIPFGQNGELILPLVLYILFVNLVIVGSSNAFNLTDGLDGLASVPAIINLTCLIILIYCSSSPSIAVNLKIPHVYHAGELIFFCIALMGAIMAFLTYNFKPAKIFMGDVGSLGIGSVLGIIAIIIKQEIVFFIISLLFVIEALSVILQVTSYKIQKKRIFLMAPIHHHFEKQGWSEQKVVTTFWLAALIFALVGMLIFFI